MRTHAAQLAAAHYALEGGRERLPQGRRAAQAYFDLLAARDTLQFVRAKKTAVAELLAQAKLNFEIGTATITDTNEAQAKFDELTPLRTAAGNPPPQPEDMNHWVKTVLDLVGTHRHGIAVNQANTGVRSDLIVNTVGVQLAIPLISGNLAGINRLLGWE